MQGFWDKALHNADLPSLIPHERWAIEAAYAPDVAPDKMYVRFAGFLPSLEAFDAGAFRSVCHYSVPRLNQAVVSLYLVLWCYQTT